MGFLQGRVSWERFAVGGSKVRSFGTDEIDRLAEFAIHTQDPAEDGSTVGFAAGGHLLDVDFQLEKNIVNDAMHASLRIDTNQPPAALVKAYTVIELAALAAENPSGHPTRKQKQEAKEAALEKLQQEAKSGKFRRLKQVPFLWDAKSSTLYLSSGSANIVDRFRNVFELAFDRPLDRITSTTLAERAAKAAKLEAALAEVEPAVFHAEEGTQEINWVDADRGGLDFLGNEFLLWIGYHFTQGEAIELADESETHGMLSKSLSLECPLGQSGKQSLSHESPLRLSEAMEALRIGKLPRKAGLILARHNIEYQLALQAESLSVGSAALPRIDADTPQAVHEERIDQIRHLTQTIDATFAAFCQLRLSKGWAKELDALRNWIHSTKSVGKKKAG